MCPLQVLYDTIDEPLYDGQICLAEFILRILFGKFCLSITPQWLNTEIPDIVWQVLHSCVVSILGTILRSSLQGMGVSKTTTQECG